VTLPSYSWIQAKVDQRDPKSSFDEVCAPAMCHRHPGPDGSAVHGAVRNLRPQLAGRLDGCALERRRTRSGVSGYGFVRMDQGSSFRWCLALSAGSRDPPLSNEARDSRRAPVARRLRSHALPGPSRLNTPCTPISSADARRSERRCAPHALHFSSHIFDGVGYGFSLRRELELVRVSEASKSQRSRFPLGGGR